MFGTIVTLTSGTFFRVMVTSIYHKQQPEKTALSIVRHLGEVSSRNNERRQTISFLIPSRSSEKKRWVVGDGNRDNTLLTHFIAVQELMLMVCKTEAKDWQAREKKMLELHRYYTWTISLLCPLSSQLVTAPMATNKGSLFLSKSSCFLRHESPDYRLKPNQLNSLWPLPLLLTPDALVGNHPGGKMHRRDCPRVAGAFVCADVHVQICGQISVRVPSRMNCRWKDRKAEMECFKSEVSARMKRHGKWIQLLSCFLPSASQSACLARLNNCDLAFLIVLSCFMYSLQCNRYNK